MDDVLAATAWIARAVDLPVTANIVSGYGATSDAAAETVRAVIATGAVGINIADGLHASAQLGTIDDAVARIRAARNAADQAGVPIVINARTDTYLRPFGDSPDLRLDKTVRRGRAYFAAGADCLYPIGVADAATLVALMLALDDRST